MKLAITTCMHNRPEVSRIFFEGVERLKRETGYNITVYAAITDNKENRELCSQYGAVYKTHANRPLGAKWNCALTMPQDFDYLLILGDDDLVSSEYLSNAIFEMRHYRWIHAGTKTVTFIRPYSEEALQFTYPFACNKLVGAGRIISRECYQYYLHEMLVEFSRDIHDFSKGDKIQLPVNQAEYMVNMEFAQFDSVVFEPFQPHINSGCDKSIETKLVLNGAMPQLFTTQSGVVDIKTSNNIWDFEKFRNISKFVDYTTSIEFIGGTERELLRALQGVTID